jgi:hypothetical protein
MQKCCSAKPMNQQDILATTTCYNEGAPLRAILKCTARELHTKHVDGRQEFQLLLLHVL